jgi:hypothetical protein
MHSHEKYNVIITYFYMSNVQVLRGLVNNLERSLNLLASPEFAQVNDLPALQQDFRVLKARFQELSRLTNRGRATAELRTAKLKALKKWLADYSTNWNQTVTNAVPQRYRNKDAIIDTTALDQYQRYAHLALQYMANLTSRYQDVKEKVDAILEVGRMLNTHLHKFDLTEEDLPSVDQLSDDDGLEELSSDELEEELDLSKAPTVAPLKMIKSVGALLKLYARFIKKVEAKYDEMQPLIDRLELVSLDELFPKINHRNNLVQSLFKNLVNINKLLYQGKFHGGLAFRKKYYELVGECLPYLPESLAAQVRFMLARTQPKSPAEEAVEHSVGGIRRYDPLKDPEMGRSSPHLAKEPVSPTPQVWQPDPKKVEEVSKTLRSLPLAPKPVVRPANTQSEPPASGERVRQDIGERISPQDKARYEKLWEVAAGFEVKHLTKQATILSQKYGF